MPQCSYDSNVATVTIDVACVKDPPVVAADQSGVAVDEGQLAANSGTLSDIDSASLLISVTVGTVIDNGNGIWSWSYAPNDGPAESQTVTITAVHGQIVGYCPNPILHGAK